MGIGWQENLAEQNQKPWRRQHLEQLTKERRNWALLPKPCQLSDFWSCPCSSQLPCVGSEGHPGYSFSSRYLSQQPSESSVVLKLLGSREFRCTTCPNSHSGYVASLKLASAGDFIPWNSANAAKRGFLPSYQSWLLNIYQSVTALALAKIREKGQWPENHAKKESYLRRLPIFPQSQEADSCNQNTHSLPGKQQFTCEVRKCIPTMNKVQSRLAPTNRNRKLRIYKHLGEAKNIKGSTKFNKQN